MSDVACGIHALDATPNDSCPHCTRIRIQSRDVEIERLRAELQRVTANVGLWLVLGSHRTCECKACEDLREVAKHAAESEVSNGTLPEM